MKKALIPAILGAGLIVSTPAHAAYGPAGCGLGSQFFDKEGNATGVMGAFTSLVNSLFWNQAISVLLNIGDCKSGGASNVDTFIQDNASELAFEFAQGQGENVETVSNMLGCEQANLIAYGNTNYNMLFATPESLSNGLQTYASNQCGI